MSEDNEVALVTGATKGIGFATATRLAHEGYRLVVTGRSEDSAEDAAHRIMSVVPDSDVIGIPLDLASLKSVRSFIDAFGAVRWPLHLLVNNAGQMQVDPSIRFSEDGVEMTLATNVIGPFLLTAMLVPELTKAAPTRIVNVTSRMHMPNSGFGAEVNWDWDNLEGQKSFDPVVAYKNSRLAVMWFTYELNRRLPQARVTANAVCPGFVPESIVARGDMSETDAAQVAKFSPWPVRSVAQAADNTVFAATNPKYATVGGLLIAEQAEVDSSSESYDEGQAKRFWQYASELVDAPPVGR